MKKYSKYDAFPFLACPIGKQYVRLLHEVVNKRDYCLDRRFVALLPSPGRLDELEDLGVSPLFFFQAVGDKWSIFYIRTRIDGGGDTTTRPTWDFGLFFFVEGGGHDILEDKESKSVGTDSADLKYTNNLS